MPSSLIIAGTHSGVGKTTAALGLMAALRRRDLVVQPFKVGPDFIDPGHHLAVTGRVSRNLDTWILSAETVRQTFDRAAASADVAIIEGVMGLFDGKGADDLRGSTADVARLVDAPVILVIDASSMAASAAAIVKGFRDFDPTIRVAGVICNRVAGPKHYTYLESAIRRHTDVVPLGWLPKDPTWEIPERHLGLMTAQDFARNANHWQALGQWFEQTVDVNRLLGHGTVAQKGREGRTPHSALRSPPSALRSRVAVARDAAFCFYYPENLELLETAGAEIVPFSPLSDEMLPEGAQLVYLGGGYPELHAQRLAENEPMRASIRQFHQSGGAIYAECGGLMYVCRELVDAAGRTFPMLDLLPARTIMQKRLAALGYVTWRAELDCLLGPAGTEIKGHEYHYSRLEPLGPMEPHAMLLRDGQEPRPDGFVSGNLLAGYAHLHFLSCPQAARSLLAFVQGPKQ